MLILSSGLVVRCRR